MQQEGERERGKERAHSIVQQDIEADVEESDIYSTAGGTAGQAATGARTRMRPCSRRLTESKSAMDSAEGRRQGSVPMNKIYVSRVHCSGSTHRLHPEDVSTVLPHFSNTQAWYFLPTPPKYESGNLRQVLGREVNTSDDASVS